jgi:predicted nucleic acid-binding protein
MLLDTNVVSAFLRGRAPKVDDFVTNLLTTQNLTVAFVTQFELRRGIEDLVLRGQGRRRKVALLKFLDRCEVLGLDAGSGAGWNHAAELWARARVHKPSIVFTDADLLIAATASFHKQTLVTSEAGLVANLEAVGVLDVHLLSGA